MSITKNVTMSLNSTLIQPVYQQQQPFVPAPPHAPTSPKAPPTLEKLTTVTFSAQFDSEYKAMEFARIMLNAIQHYGD